MERHGAGSDYRAAGGGGCVGAHLDDCTGSTDSSAQQGDLPGACAGCAVDKWPATDAAKPRNDLARRDCKCTQWAGGDAPGGVQPRQLLPGLQHHISHIHGMETH